MEVKTAQCPLGAECETVKDKVMYRCPWYVQVRGVNPNTGEEVDNFDCAIAWTPILLIENSQQQRQTGAAVESFRNEVIKQNNQISLAIQQDAERRLIK